MVRRIHALLIGAGLQILAIASLAMAYVTTALVATLAAIAGTGLAEFGRENRRPKTDPDPDLGPDRTGESRSDGEPIDLDRGSGANSNRRTALAERERPTDRPPDGEWAAPLRERATADGR